MDLASEHLDADEPLCQYLKKLRQEKEHDIVGLVILGEVNISATVSQAATAILLVDNLVERFNEPGLRETMSELRREGGMPLMRGALIASGFRMLEAPEGTRSDSGTARYTAEYDGLWQEWFNFPHLLAAESGMQIEGSFRFQEDGAGENIYWYAEFNKALVKREKIRRLTASQ